MGVINKITLPSTTTYDIEDSLAQSRIDALEQTIAGGVSFIIAWDGTGTPVAASIPKGVVVSGVTGTLEAADATPGAFYLVKSATDPSGQPKDVYDEYVVVKPELDDSTTWFWEKIGDTQVDLSDVVTDVSLSKTTANVIGADSTFSVTQPTVALATGASAGTGVISLVTGISSAAASGDSVTALTGLGTPTTDSVIGADATFTVTQPSVNLTANATSSTGRITYVESQGTATTTNIKATASGAAVTASGDSVTALTGLGTPTTDNAVKSVTPTTKKLATTTVTGVSGSTSPNVVQGRTSQTTADGTGTASTTNTDWLKGVSVSNETLVIGAATLDTQTTYSANAPAAITIPTAASSATTVATGGTTTSGSGANVVTDVSVGDTIAAVTGYSSPTTDTVLGTGSNFNVTQPTVALSTNASSGTGVISVATGIGSATTKYLSASAANGNVAWNSKDTVSAVTGYATPTTDTVLGTGSTITVTPTTTNVKATASNGGVAWNSKDQKTVLTNTTDVSVTKGS